MSNKMLLVGGPWHGQVLELASPRDKITNFRVESDSLVYEYSIHEWFRERLFGARRRVWLRQTYLLLTWNPSDKQKAEIPQLIRDYKIQPINN